MVHPYCYTETSGFTRSSGQLALEHPNQEFSSNLSYDFLIVLKPECIMHTFIHQLRTKVNPRTYPLPLSFVRGKICKFLIS